MDGLRQLYADYLAEAHKVRKNASAFAGVFGLGDDPRKHPCHEVFYQNVEKWIEEFVASGPDCEQAGAVASFLLEEPGKNVKEEGYWFLYACLGFIRNLVPFLSGEDCKVLATRMNSLYPRRERMPVQQETFIMLQKAGK